MTQAERRRALRERQAERDARVTQRLRLARIKQLVEDEPAAIFTAQLNRMAIEAIEAEPDGLDADKLPQVLLDSLVERQIVAVFRGRVAVRGRHV